MNISDELRKLADLRTEGHLSEQEFIDAKKSLLSGNHSAPPILSREERATVEAGERVPKTGPSGVLVFGLV